MCNLYGIVVKVDYCLVIFKSLIFKTLQNNLSDQDTTIKFNYSLINLSKVPKIKIYFLLKTLKNVHDLNAHDGHVTNTQHENIIFLITWNIIAYIHLYTYKMRKSMANNICIISIYMLRFLKSITFTPKNINLK